MKENSGKTSPPLEVNPLDMSSIDDNEKSQSQDSSPLDIQEMGLAMLEDEAEFRDNVRELLITDPHDFQGEDPREEGEGDGEFEGEPLKGSFLREMEILGKTLSFQSTAYNIYEGCEDNGPILSFLTQQKSNQTTEMTKFAFALKNIERNTLQIESKYIVDFSIGKSKAKKADSKCKCKNKQADKSKKMVTDAHNSTKSMSNFMERPRSEKKIVKNKTKNKSSRRKSPKYNEEEHRKSELSAYMGKLKKNSSSPLRKVGYSSTISEILKTKQSEAGSMLDIEARRKKIEQKINMRTKF